MKIFINYHDNMIPLEISKNTTIGAIKYKLQYMVNLNTESQFLLFKGSALKDYNTLSRYNIHEGNILTLITFLEESKTIESQIKSGNNINICNCNNYNRKINGNKGQFFVEQKGTRNQLYKLVEAIPVRFCEIEGAFLVNQNTNLQLDFQQYNNDTYLMNNTNSDNYSNYQINTQSSGSDYNNTINNELKCICHLGKEQSLIKEQIK